MFKMNQNKVKKVKEIKDKKVKNYKVNQTILQQDKIESEENLKESN